MTIPEDTAAGDSALDGLDVPAVEKFWEMATLGDPLADLGLHLVYRPRVRARPGRVGRLHQ